MKSEILEYILNNKLYKIDNKPIYEGNIDKTINLLSINEFINIIKESKNYELYKELINSINPDIIYKSDIHGISHNERVSLLIYGISILENITSIRDIKILIYAAMYHDTGRVNDLDDEAHGARSAGLLDKIDIDLNKEDMRILKLICTYHSIDDSKTNFESYEGLDVNRTKRLLDILKDADALDRFRTNDLNVKYLRKISSLRIVNVAFLLYENYNRIKKSR